MSVKSYSGRLGLPLYDRTKRHLLLLAIVGAMVHFSWLFLQPNHVRPDTLSYIQPAHGMLKGEGFSRQSDNGSWELETSRTPGYPLFLAAIFYFSSNILAVIVVQKLGIIAISLFFYLYFVNRLGFSERLMLVAMILLNLDLATVIAANRVLSEALFCMFLVALFVCFAETIERKKIKWAIAAGLLCGFSALIRPIGIVFFVPLAILLVLVGRPIKRSALVAVIFVAGSVFLPGLWIYRNYTLFGELAFSSISGKSLLYYRAAGAFSFSQGISYKEAFDRLKQEAEKEFVLQSGALGRPLGPFEKNRIRKRLGFSILREHPMETVKTGFFGLGKIFFGPASPARLKPETAVHSRVVHALQYAVSVLWWVFGAIGFLALWKGANKQRRKMLVLLALFIVYFVLMSAGMEAYSRFRVPFMPYLAVFASGGLLFLLRILQRRDFTPASLQQFPYSQDRSCE